MVVHIVDILGTQLVTIVIDFVLDVERTVYIIVLTVSHEDSVHLRQGIIRKLKHLVHVVILLVSEVFLAMEASVLSACNIETSIADTLQLRDFTKHGTHLLLRFITQMGI